MSTTWTSVLEYTNSIVPQVTVNLMFHHWSRRTHVLIWCLRALCWLTSASLVILEK